MRQVKKAEHLKLLHEDSADLFYSGKVSGISADVTYKFYKAKLYLGQIDFMEGHDGTAAIADFSQIKAAIESVYGNTDSKLHWTNAALEYSASDHVDQWGEAVEQGYLSMDCTWSAGPAVSELSLSGGDDGIHLHFISQNQTLAPGRPSAEGEF